jgi:hypothetical protein
MHEEIEALAEWKVAEDLRGRMVLAAGSSARDVYSDFIQRAYDAADPVRTRDELAAVIRDAGVRYEDCNRLSVSDEWVYGNSDEPGARVFKAS